MPIVHFIGIFK